MISSADIKLIGKTSGTLVTTANGTSSSGSDMDKGIPFIRKVNGALEAGGKSYDNIDKFTTKMSGQNPDKASALSSFNAATKDKSFLKAGLSALPYVGAALSMLDYFMGGGKDEGPQQVSMQPMTIEMSTTTTGTMTASNLYATVPFHNPGNRLTTIPENVPYYNEAMGVISLLKRPVVDGKSGIVAYPNRDRISTSTFRLTQDLSYALNPAARLEVQDFQVALVAEGLDAGPAGANSSFGNYEGQVVQPDGTFHSLYRTDYFDAACIKNQQFSWQYTFNPETGYSSPAGQLTNIYLKVMVNLKPTDNPAAQNVLFVARYPVTRQSVTAFAAIPTAACGVLPQASPDAIAALCSSSKYKQAITLLRTRPTSVAATSPAVAPATAQLLAIPNPATGSVRLSGYVAQPGRVRLTLSDNLGREVRTVLDQEQGVGPLEVTVPLDGLAAGIYYGTLQTAGQRLVTKIAVAN